MATSAAGSLLAIFVPVDGHKRTPRHSTLEQLLLMFYWVAVRELTVSYYIGETVLATTYIHYGNINGIP